MFACGSMVILWGSHDALCISCGIDLGMASAVLVEIEKFSPDVTNSRLSAANLVVGAKEIRDAVTVITNHIAHGINNLM